MRVLLDHNVPHGLRSHFHDHEVVTAAYEGWEGLRDDALLRHAQQTFDVLVTLDRGFQHQQNLPAFDIAVLLLRPRSNRFQEIKPLIPAALSLMSSCRPGRCYVVE